MTREALNPDGIPANPMQELCRQCGNTFGAHCADNRGPRCPANEGRMDYLDPPVFFDGTGIYEPPRLTNRWAFRSTRRALYASLSRRTIERRRYVAFFSWAEEADVFRRYGYINLADGRRIKLRDWVDAGRYTTLRRRR